MKRLTQAALSYRTVAIMVILVVGYLGFDSFQRLPRREMPNIPIPFAQVITYYPGASAEDTERLVTKRLEQRFTEINDVKNVFSTTKPGISIVMVELEYGSPTKANWDKLRNKVDDERSKLPRGVRGPFVNDEFADTNIMLVSLAGDEFSYRQLEDYAETVRDRLKRIPDVGKIVIDGTQAEVVNLYAKEGLTSESAPDLQTVSRVLSGKNIVYPGAQLYPDGAKVKLNTTGRIESLKELENLIVRHSAETGSVARVGDLFELEQSIKRPEALIRHRGHRAVVVAVAMRPGANVIKVGEDIEAALKELRSMLPPSLKVQKVTDMPSLVEESIQSFTRNLGEAVAIVLVVAMLFMGVLSGLVMAIAIPASMLLTFLVMRLIGWDLHAISISALIIALGMLVDNAIVITDNIHEKMAQGLDRRKAALEGTSELVAPVLTSTLTTVAIFVPLSFMPGIAGDFVKSIPVVVSIVLLSSFLVALVVTPLMSYYLLKQPKSGDEAKERGGEATAREPREGKEPTSKPQGEGSRKKASSRLYSRLKKTLTWPYDQARRVAMAYHRLLHHSLRRPWIPVAVALLLFGVGIFGLMKVGKQYFPKDERERFVVDVWLPDAASLESTLEVVKKVEGLLSQEKPVKSYTSFLGKGAPKYDLGINPEPRNTNYAHFMVVVDDKKNTEGVVERLNKAFRKRVPGARITAKEFRNGPPVGDDIQIRLYGDKLEVLSEIAFQIEEILRGTKGTFDVSDNLGYRIPSVDVIVDDYRASLLGLNHIAVAGALRSYVEGYRAGTLWDDEEEIPVLLRAQRSFQDSLFVYTNTSFPIKSAGAGGGSGGPGDGSGGGPGGGPGGPGDGPGGAGQEAQSGQRGAGSQGSLLELGRFKPRWRVSQIHRRNNERSVTISAQVAGRLPSQVMAEVRPKLAKIPLPAGYRLEIGGESEKRSEGFADLGNAMIIGLVAIIILLVVLFNSFRHTVVVLATLPLSLMGAVLGLFITQTNFGFMAYLGLISLFGVVVNNALVLLDFVPGQIRKGRGYIEALEDAGLRRLRPILLTTFTTVGGLLPLYFFGGPLWKAMAAVLMFGLLVSTFLTLLIIPCMYALIVKDREEKQIRKEQEEQRRARREGEVGRVGQDQDAGPGASDPQPESI